MKGEAVFCVFVGLFLVISDASNSPGYGDQGKARWCYSCAYSPPSTNSGQGYGIYGSNDIGGWDKCLAPFGHRAARQQGIDLWLCHSNCYVRTDPNGNVFRGCYKEEYGVDQSLIGCNLQAGSTYCFCAENACNTFAAEPAPPKSAY